MKFFFLQFYFILIPFSLFPQSYESCFGTNETKMSIVYQNEYPATFEFIFSNTIKLDSFQYWQLDNYDFYVREDSSHAKLYARCEDTEDKLIMDMDLAKGDTFFYEYRLRSHEEYADYYYAIVDTVYYSNNKKHISFSKVIFNYNHGEDDTFEFIESVGPNTGIIYQHTNSCAGLYWIQFPELLCQTKDSILQYLNPQYDSCYFDYFGDDIKDPSTNGIRVYPNPVNDYVLIFTEKSSEWIIKITSLEGLVFYNNKLQFLQNRIVTSAFPSGIYILELFDSKNYITKKILKL